MDKSISREQIIRNRLRAHHLDAPAESLLLAAAACGFQNSPPGAWETAAFNRLAGGAWGGNPPLTVSDLDRELYETKRLIQAWSFRGAPRIFPAMDAPVFLHSLIAKNSHGTGADGNFADEPWIYTDGLPLALSFLNMDAEALLPLVQDAAALLNDETVLSKSALDAALAGRVAEALPEDKRMLWDAPSMYGPNQTVGGAVVSFLLRPCSFCGLVLFGKRQGAAPTFTSPARWLGREGKRIPIWNGSGSRREENGETAEGARNEEDDTGSANAAARQETAERELLRRYLRCYGPSSPELFARFLGCSAAQARRLWAGGEDIRGEEDARLFAEGEAPPPTGKSSGEDGAGGQPPRLLLLAAHDPYLELYDRELILPDKALQKQVWKIVGNPGAILYGGHVIGTWQARTEKKRLSLSVRLWRKALDALPAGLQAEPEALTGPIGGWAHRYAAFRETDAGKLNVTVAVE